MNLLILYACTAVYCNPKKMYLTDIHQPTLDNLKFNAMKNNLLADSSHTEETKVESVFKVDPNYNHSSSSGEDDSTRAAGVVEVLNLNWKDPATYPKQAVDVILGADLVYDVAILQMLVPAIEAILSEGMSEGALNLKSVCEVEEMRFIFQCICFYFYMVCMFVLYRWHFSVLCP